MKAVVVILAISLAGAGFAMAPGAPQAAAASPSSELDGKALFQAKCALCHVGFGPGTISLEQRHGKAMSLLAERTDLEADYVRAVVRTGLATMPPFTRVDVTDDQLDRIATYLAAPGAAAKAGGKAQ